MNDVEEASEILLTPAGITEQNLQQVLGQLIGPAIDAADLYFQSVHHESWALEDGIVKGASFNIHRGVGVRAMCGEKTGFAYSDDILLPALTQAANAARSISNAGQHGQVRAMHQVTSKNLYPAVNPLTSLPNADKIALLQELDHYARAKDNAVKQVMVSLAGVHEVVLVMNHLGVIAGDIRPLIRLNVSIVAEKNGRREQSGSGGGGRCDYSYFLANNQQLARHFVDEAVRQALLNLEAKPAPAGMMPVVLGPGWPGVLLHEAVGHGLEGDFNRRGTSVFSGRIGQRVATEQCTVVDDGTLVGKRGSLNMDDEGTPSQCTVLIENGILRGYLQDTLNAKLMGTQSTGNGRRESYACLPMPRMTNTYLRAGKYAPEEIIASVDRGIYAVNFGGGQVDITSGKFVFSASEAYLIEQGKIQYPIKGVTLIGNGPEVLTKVSMVGNDLRLDEGVGTCGKDGQSVPVGVGQPTLKVDMLTVGGTE